MGLSYAGFVDVGFLKAEGARALRGRSIDMRPVAAAVVEWLLSLKSRTVGCQVFLRAYWYDGAFDSTHPTHHDQRRFFDAIAFTPGIQLRLGHVAERQARLENPIKQALRSTALGLGLDPQDLLGEFDKHWTFHPERQQKGVDTLITLDVVRLAERHAYDTAILLAGDRDLAEAVRTAQDVGKRVIVATPSRDSWQRSWPSSLMRSLISMNPPCDGYSISQADTLRLVIATGVRRARRRRQLDVPLSVGQIMALLRAPRARIWDLPESRQGDPSPSAAAVMEEMRYESPSDIDVPDAS